MWDSGVVLAKFIEHAVDSKRLLLKGKKVVELGSGCGLIGVHNAKYSEAGENFQLQHLPSSKGCSINRK
ncbi:hypothetical protein KSP39_PZI009570 [Platanthera zijinensis]|uniref:Uncharacterized protein n=1 Tax=Platanthera zijinensis TaxID=2320716 RepID=A0AAP0G7I7_9ASPA